VDLAADIHAGGTVALAVERANASVQLLDGGGEAGHQAEVGKVCRAVVDGDTADAQGQGAARGGCGRRAGGLGYQQFTQVGRAVFIDDEAHIGLLQVDAGDVQVLAVLVIQAVEVEFFPAYEIASLELVEAVQLLDLRGAAYLQLQGRTVAQDRKSTRLNSSHVKISY